MTTDKDLPGLSWPEDKGARRGAGSPGRHARFNGRPIGRAVARSGRAWVAPSLVPEAFPDLPTLPACRSYSATRVILPVCTRGRWSRSTARTRCVAISTIRAFRASRGRSISESTSRRRTGRLCTRSAPAIVHLEGLRSLSVADGDLDFGYWHVIPAVSHHQRVGSISSSGRVESPWLHLHFAEHRAGVYRDPLRRGALTPWRDTTKPQVTRIVFSRAGRVLDPARSPARWT